MYSAEPQRIERYNRDECAVEERAQPQVIRWLSELDHSLATTERLVHELIERLGSVTTPMLPSSGDNLKACVAESMAPLAEQIKSKVQAHERTNEMIQGLFKRLQI